MNEGRSVQERGGAAVAAGIVIGAVAGVAELLLFHGRLTATPREVLYAAALYAGLGSVLGLLFFGLASAAAAIGLRTFDRRLLPAALSFQGAAFALFLVGYRVNLRPGMPPALSPRGLAFNAGLALAAAGVALALTFLLDRAGRAWWERAMAALRPASAVLLAVPVLLLLSLAGFSAARSLSHRPPPGTEGISRGRPPVVVILVDALRKDHLSGYGYARRTTPTLDRLMEESVVFENAYAASNWTVPSLASLFTGTTPVTHGVVSAADRLPDKERTLAERLSQEGYACGAFFGNAIVDIGGGFDRGFHRRHPRAKPFWCYHLQTAVERVAIRLVRGVYFRADRVLGEAESWVRERGDRPFFAYVHLMEAHSPYEPPPPYDTRFDPGYAGPVRNEPPLERATVDRGFRDWEAVAPGEAAIPEEERAHMVALYDGEVAFADERIGRFLDHLREWEAYDRALVIVTADHGEEFFDHGGWFHGQSLYDELVRVPLIVKFPAGAHAGERRKGPVSGIDLVPSVLCVLGLRGISGVDGRDVLTAPADSGRVLFPERPPFLYSVIEGPWKLVLKRTAAGEELRLYDRAEDPRETTNLVDARPEVRDRLAALLAGRVEAAAGPGLPTENLTAFQREQLKALGYVQ